MTNAERIAHVIFGGDGRELGRRAVSELVPQDFLGELGLTRRTSHMGGALVMLAAGVALGAAGYHVFGPQGRPVRARMLEWMRGLGKEVEGLEQRVTDGASDAASKAAKREQTGATGPRTNHS